MTRAKLRVLVCVLGIGLIARSSDAAELLGVHWDTGTLYRISPSNAAITAVGGGALNIGALELASDGWVYGVSLFDNVIYRINPQTFVSTPHSDLTGISMFEGGLTFAPSGLAYLVSGGSALNPELHILDVNTGVTNLIGEISGGEHDINGLVWRSDGMLVGLDRSTNSLLAIDPFTAAATVIASLTPTLGAIGGMTVIDGVGYFNTSGPATSLPGSNELWSFDLFTGAHTLVGSLAPTIAGTGISGLSVIPEPACASVLALGCLFLRRHGENPQSRTL